MEIKTYRPASREHPVHSDEITAEMVEYYVRYGKHLRAVMIAAWLGSIRDRIFTRFRRHAARLAQQPREQMTEHFANGLAAIRSSAEVLRDNKDLSQFQRQRFVSIVLDEEARLERLLADLPCRPRIVNMA